MIGSTINITTSPTPIATGSVHQNVNYPMSLIIKNPTGGQAVFLGGPTVDTTGYPIAPGEIISLDIVEETLYGVVAGTTQNINVLRRGTVAP